MIAVLDSGLHKRALRFGYVSSNCDGCAAAGRGELRAAPRSQGGAPTDPVCPDCGGSGRWWFPETRTSGMPTAHLTDVELRVLLRSGIKQEVARGDQG